MPRFRKTTTIEAIQWTGDNPVQVRDFGKGKVLLYNHTIRVRTLEGLSDSLPIGYWIATDGADFWPIADAFMRANYEQQEDDDGR